MIIVMDKCYFNCFFQSFKTGTYLTLLKEGKLHFFILSYSLTITILIMWITFFKKRISEKVDIQLASYPLIS